jgi:uncharacterized membrane protein YbhN (UPF0104 family)
MRNVVESIYRTLHGHLTWRRIGVALGVAVTFAACYVLYRLLRNIDPAEVLEAISQTEPRNVLFAALFVAAAYLTLTFYDFFALRTIGRGDVPYRIAAIAGFTSYSIGHNVGFTVFSGGTVRYRIYSTAVGLSAVDVAKIVFIAGLTFWLGNAAVLGLGFVVHPEAASSIIQFPEIVSRLLGINALIALAFYVAWVSVQPRSFGSGTWKVRLPSGRLTLLQILIGVADLTCCAAAMYMLMPADPPIDFISLAVIFITATLFGFASHAPGGIGVFDATMLIALSQFETEPLVGALLLFRLLYYIVPFVIALGVVACREFIFELKPLAATKSKSEGRAP